MNYTKPALDLQQQIDKLKQRGLSILDEPRAAHYLSNISFYRLRAYTYPFQDNSDPNHPFIKPVSFDEIISLYVFDRRLRLLLFNALEKIEISFRTKLVYEFSQNNGSHWYENPGMYRNAYRFNTDINQLYEEIRRSNETFIGHYFSNYTNPINPPAWMSLEVASIGLLSKLFINLKKGSEKIKVTNQFGLTKPEILESWIHSLTTLRNICAHHGRLWNRRFIIQPTMPYNTKYQFIKNRNIHTNKLYALLCCINYILNIISPNNSFKPELRQLIQSCHLVDLHEMGFPKDWENDPFWQV